MTSEFFPKTIRLNRYANCVAVFFLLCLFQVFKCKGTTFWGHMQEN